ncbi:MAG: sn-glycerol-3-phosphate ABC transporter ATP-binding protein UgpC [Gemmatimonadota bacterium]
MASVNLEGVRKIYEDRGKVHVAVNDVSLAIADGEFLVLVGPSGCGKSTTLRMVAGLEIPSAGTVRIGSQVVNDVPARDRDIAMVFQNYALYPHMTVRENLAFALKLRKVAPAEVEKRVTSTAEMLGIGMLLDRRPRQLSGGQRQRVALGRAVVRQPQVFLFDEPLSNLDARLRVETRREIAALRRRLGTTAIYVTHDQVEAMTLGDRIVVMKDGDVQQVGTPLTIYRQPASTFVATFIGSPPMNLLPGAVVPGPVPGLAISGSALRIPLATRLPATLAPAREVTLGIRPESIRLGSDGDSAAVVEEVEPLGGETIVTLLSEGARITARVDGALDIGRGASVRWSVAPGEMHWFDAATGLRIGGGVPGSAIGARR